MKVITAEQWCVHEANTKYTTSLASTLFLWMMLANIFDPETHVKHITCCNI